MGMNNSRPLTRYNTRKEEINEIQILFNERWKLRNPTGENERMV